MVEDETPGPGSGPTDPERQDAAPPAADEESGPTAGAEASTGTGVSTRRRFVNWLLGTSAGALAVSIVYPVISYLIPPPSEESATRSVTLGLTPGDVDPDTGHIFRFGNEPGILIRTPSGELRAFEATCTHLSCTIQYRADLDHLWCACHNGHYDLQGTNIKGPPPRPLEQYTVNVKGDEIIVSRRG